MGPLELPTRRQKRLKRKREKAAATANNVETYEEPEIKQENSFDEVRRMDQLLFMKKSTNLIFLFNDKCKLRY